MFRSVYRTTLWERRTSMVWWLLATLVLSIWLVAFYGSWLAFVVFGGYLQTVADHWPMAAAMAAGSYVAGSTPMGGGTVGFPVLVLLMDLPAMLGRDFSFAIQAVGMTSASIYILCSRQELEWPMLRAALPGALVGTPLGILFVAPLASDLFIKLLFAAMWCSFGLLHLRRINEITADEPINKMLRVSVEGGGCSGFQYRFDLVPEAEIERKLAEVPSTHPSKVRFLDRVNFFGQAVTMDRQGRTSGIQEYPIHFEVSEQRGPGVSEAARNRLLRSLGYVE